MTASEAEIAIEGRPCCGDIYSNFDHCLETWAEAKLRDGAYGEHPAWNFHGRIWFDNGVFYERVKCYGTVAGVYSNESLTALIAEVNGIYGVG